MLPHLDGRESDCRNQDSGNKSDPRTSKIDVFNKDGDREQRVVPNEERMDSVSRLKVLYKYIMIAC
jgi:hypothetical protein